MIPSVFRTTPARRCQAGVGRNTCLKSAPAWKPDTCLEPASWSTPILTQLEPILRLQLRWSWNQLRFFLGPTKVSPPKTENRSFVGHIPTESCTWWRFFEGRERSWSFFIFWLLSLVMFFEIYRFFISFSLISKWKIVFFIKIFC